MSAILTEDKNYYLSKLSAKIKRCKRCQLHLSRNNVVVGDGSPYSRIMFIGEAPGADEDIQGKPFVGKSGQLLTKIINAMGLSREEVYIANILKCRPPENRDPNPHEIENCIHNLFMQIDIVSPEIIVILGRVAGMTFFGKDFSITRQRGKFFQFRGFKVLATFHPAYLLMNPSAKKLTWDDMKKVLRELGLAVPSK
ncbi:MAG: uracil-DNA glycosylase [Candidatus Omnitrophica bacterium]|nr:uracil-DNA glycosylase [Candidatus Omnitrophota bacterium]